MTITFRRPAEDELVPFVRTFADVMNQKMSDEDIERGRPDVEFDRSWIAEDDGRIVGSTTGHSFTVTLPGGDTAGLGGLTLVAVLPTHRRQGVMKELIGRFFADCRDRGDTFAGLFASEAGIYGRFGFGPATRFASLTIDRDHAAGIAALATPGVIRLCRVEDAGAELAAIFERTRPQRTGELVRGERFWAGLLRRLQHVGDGRPVWAAIHEAPDGTADGYLIYRIESKWIDHTAQNEVRIAESVGTGAVQLALWRFVLELDLVRTVTHTNARLDDPLHDILADPRQLRTQGIHDQLWMRVVDVADALAARGYNGSGALTIEVIDASLPEQSGVYRVEVTDGKARCERTDAPPDLRTTARGLATAYLGDRTWRSLAHACVAEIVDPEAGARADALFAVSPSPQCLSLF